jgi:hypothetical protein
MKDKTRDLLCSVLFLTFGIFMFFQSIGIVPKIERDLGSGFMPKIVAGVLIAISIIKLIVTLTSKKENKIEEIGSDMLGGLLTIALLAAYVLLFDILGFLISTITYLFLQILILSNEKNRRIGLFAIISIIFPVVIYILFVYVIKMPLPYGIFEF